MRKECVIFQLIAMVVMVHNYNYFYRGMLGIRHLLIVHTDDTVNTDYTKHGGNGKVKPGFTSSQPTARLSTVCLQDARPNNPDFFVTGNIHIIYGTSAPISVGQMELLNIGCAKPYFRFFYRRDKNQFSAFRLLTLQSR